MCHNYTIFKFIEKEVELPPSIAISDFGKEWKKALFGKGGILTEIFNFVNDKRKDGLNKVAKAQADALPKCMLMD